MRNDIISEFLDSAMRELATGQTTEHSYRPLFKQLFAHMPNIQAINEPKQSEHGAPDFIFLKPKTPIVMGYAEMKDIDKKLDDIEKSEQMDRYKGYKNIFLTNNLDFRFFRNGVKYFEVKIGEYDPKTKTITKTYHENFDQLARELTAFFDQAPESVANGKRLAEIMGGKARRIRDNIVRIFKDKSDKEIENIYDMMKQLLVADLTPEQFADMYAQTLVYGLFVARYSDDTTENFSRAEARDLVPATNPFLREFFDHITGSNFNKSLSYIVDELCEVFAVSDIRGIVHKHLKITSDEEQDTKDPIIHFYEDFLASYDAKLRKQMGAYYTPIPVVRYIVRKVDELLKSEFGISDGIASNEKIKYTQKTDPYQLGKSKSAKTYYEKTFDIPKVQILDPAVGTATFLNETIKHIYGTKFASNAGMWQSYANDNILPRINGFELMMTPYTIAHLKLGMTLSELGAKKLNDRLRVFLTNTLTEGIEADLPLFALIGLTKVVAEESNLAAEVKNDRPMMVIMGNPPYSGVSSNETKYANALIDKYKVEPGGKQKLQERKHWLNDDYVKFIAFSENMIEKNGKGVMAMITNNGYLDNPTFRGMRWHLTQTFDKIYCLDLHGNSKKKETTPDGSKDENVFDIQQGVSVILAIKTTEDKTPAKVGYAEVYGKRQHKFDELNKRSFEFRPVKLDPKMYLFIPKNTEGQEEYEQAISVEKLFIKGSSGVQTSRDSFVVDTDKDVLEKRIETFYDLSVSDYDIRNNMFKQGSAKYERGDTRGWHISDVRRKAHEINMQRYSYRPFDNRYIDYQPELIDWPRTEVLKNLQRENISLTVGRQGQAVGSMIWNVVYIQDCISDLNLFYRGGGVVFPLYIYHDDGTKTANFDATTLTKLTTDIGEQKPEDILDYIYAILHSPSYRTKYAEFLKIDFPRIPIPTAKEFARLVPLGRELRNLHIMKAPINAITTYPESGGNEVEKISRVGNKVYINDNQYFDGVSDVAWNFYIGGYQPAQKWLKDRRGRTLNYEDIEHYERVIKVLNETDRIMKNIG